MGRWVFCEKCVCVCVLVMDGWMDGCKVGRYVCKVGRYVGMYVCMSDFLVFALRSRIIYPRMAE